MSSNSKAKDFTEPIEKSKIDEDKRKNMQYFSCKCKINSIECKWPICVCLKCLESECRCKNE